MRVRIEPGDPYKYQIMVGGQMMTQPRVVVIRLLIECKLLNIKGKVGFEKDCVTHTYGKQVMRFPLPKIGVDMQDEFENISDFVECTVEKVFDFESSLFYEDEI